MALVPLKVSLTKYRPKGLTPSGSWDRSSIEIQASSMGTLTSIEFSWYCGGRLRMACLRALRHLVVFFAPVRPWVA